MLAKIIERDKGTLSFGFTRLKATLNLDKKSYIGRERPSSKEIKAFRPSKLGAGFWIPRDTRTGTAFSIIKIPQEIAFDPERSRPM